MRLATVAAFRMLKYCAFCGTSAVPGNCIQGGRLMAIRPKRLDTQASLEIHFTEEEQIHPYCKIEFRCYVIAECVMSNMLPSHSRLWGWGEHAINAAGVKLSMEEG